MKEIKPTASERIIELEGEVKALRAEIEKLWEAHTALARRANGAILAHTRVG